MKSKNYVFLFLGILAGVNILAWVAVWELSWERGLEVTFFDVGQGDSIFIETPQLHQILIDGGPNSSILEKLGEEMPFWDRTIDLVILTHPEKDHMAGLLEVLKRYKVENILWTGVVRETSEYDEWVKLIEMEGANVFFAKAGQKIVFGDAKMTVLYPFEYLDGKLIKDSNETSIVTVLQYGRKRFIFTGDIGKTTEEILLSKRINIDADVLKVGHHGSKYSSIDEFIEKVSPEFAVIGVGQNNSYGHPSAEVLERLANYGINILRTDINGDIKILSNGINIIWKK